MNLRDLKLRVRAMIAPRRIERELDEELAFHLERETRQLVAGGMPEADARARALARFGPVPLAADACRDARGTAFVDNTVRDILYALRTFMRAPLVAFTIVSTVGLGLGLVTVAFTLLNMFLFRVDRVPDVHEMYAVERTRTSDAEPEPLTRADFDTLRRETSVFTDVYAQVSDVDGRVDGRTIFGTFVTGNTFQVLGVNAAMGRALTPGDDEPSGGRPVMVLSHRGWDRLFARDPAILGRVLLVNRLPFEIIGVMPDGFRGLASGQPDDYWAPLSMLASVQPIGRTQDANAGVSIIGRLTPGLSRETALAQLAVWDARRAGDSPSQRASTLTLVPRRGTVQQTREALMVTAPLFFAFGLILLIACANVTNLLLARGVARQREIGIRLSLGATRRRIVRQLVTESLLLALVAAAAGFAISRVVLGTAIDAMMTSMPPDIGDIRWVVPDTDWRVVVFLIVGAVASTLVFGLVPALQATRIAPLRTIRGEVMRDARPGAARNLLIGLQVSASALLLISAAVFLRTTFAAATFDPGMRIADNLIIPIVNEPARNAIVQAVSAEPSVAGVAAAWPAIGAAQPAFAAADGAKAAVEYKFVSPELFGVLDIAVVRGRAFTPAERTANVPVAIVSETAAGALWPNGDGIGRTIHLDPDLEPQARSDSAQAPQLVSRTLTVVGIVRDVAGFRIAPFAKAVVYLPASVATPGTILVARVHGDPERARQTLSDRLTAVDPGMVQVGSMEWVTRMETFFLQLAFWFTVLLGGLALALTLSGLFSVLSYLVEQRTKEIGVRMALGATTRDVARLVLLQSIRPVVLGMLAGAASAAGLATLLLSTPAAAGLGQLVHVLDPIAYAASLLVITAACLLAAAVPATRAARLDPTQTLRQE